MTRHVPMCAGHGKANCPKWSPDMQYWLENSLQVGYQNQSTAFVLGGKNVLLNGHGSGVLGWKR